MEISETTKSMRQAAASYQQARELSQAVEILTAEFPGAEGNNPGIGYHIARMRADIADMIADAQSLTTPAEFAIIVAEYPNR